MANQPCSLHLAAAATHCCYDALLLCDPGSLKNLVACDVLWSDPVNDPGIRVNEARGCGTVFGPDVTADFLAANGLRLIIRRCAWCCVRALVAGCKGV